MKLVDAFRTRAWGAAVALTLIAGPFFGMLYLGRGRLAVIYGIVDALGVVAGFAIAVTFNLIGPDVGPGSLAIGLWPVRIVGAIHGARLARALQGAVPSSWVARWSTLLAAWLVLALGPPLAAGMVRVLWLESFVIRSASMAPALIEDDRLFADKRAYRAAEPAAGDIVVVRDYDGVQYVRRIVAFRNGLYVTDVDAPGGKALSVIRSAIVGKVFVVYWSARTRRWQWEAPR